jgi:hypothetical protein
MGYRSERDKDGNKIPHERSGKPRRHRDDHLDLSKQTGTPVYPPSSSVYKHAQPFYLPDTQNTPKPGLVPTVAQSEPLLAPSDRQHHSVPIVLETPWPSRPSVSQEDRVMKDLLAEIPPPVQNPMSVLAGYRDPVPDPHRIEDTKASIKDPFIDPHDSMNTRRPSIPVTQKPVTDLHRARTRDPYADSHCVKDARESSIRYPPTDSRRVTDTRKSSSAAPRGPTTDSHSTYAATRNVADARGSWGAAVQDLFSHPHIVPATRHSPSPATRAAELSKPDASRRMPAAYPEPDVQDSSPRSAASSWTTTSTTTLHTPVPTRRPTQRPVVPSIHPFLRANNSPARSTDTSGTSKKYVSPHHPLPMPAHLLALPSPLSRSSMSSSTCSSISKHCNASHAQKLATPSQTTSSSRPLPSPMSPAPSPSHPPSYRTLPPLPPPLPARFSCELPARSSALFELEQNPRALSPRSPMPRKSSLKRADSLKSARNVGFADKEEVRTYEEDEAANRVGN